MNRRNSNNNCKFTSKISKSFKPPLNWNLLDDKYPDCDQLSLKTSISSSTNVTECSRNSSESGMTSHHLIKNTYMRLRSKCRCTINPFDLSSDCDDDDFVDNKYSFSYKTRQYNNRFQSIATSNDSIPISFDLESNTWSEIDQFSSNITNLYNFSDLTDGKKNSNDNLNEMRTKKRSPEGEIDLNDINRKRPKLAFSYEFRQRHLRPPQKLSNRPSPLPIMRDSSSNHVHIPEISNQTIHDLLIGRYSCYLNEFVIIDCRFPYEYDGGHISDSINIYTCRQLLQYLIGSSSQLDIDLELHRTLKILHLDDLTNNFDNKAFIFYCEFSSFRGPKLAQCLRGLDRLANSPFHTQLKIPNIYILHGGYIELFGKYPQLCSPEGYVGMKQTRYSLRSPNDPSISLSPTSHGGSPTNYESYSKFVPESPSIIITDETTRTKNRKQQINCQQQLKTDAKRLSDIVATFTKNSDIIRLFKFDEIS